MASQVVQCKEYAYQCRRHKRCKFDPWVKKILWRSKSQPDPVLLPGKIPWKEEPCGLQFMWAGRVGHDWATEHAHAHICFLLCRHLSGDLVTESCSTLEKLWTVTCQAPLSMGFPGQEYWSWLPFSSPGKLPDSGIEPGLLHYRQILYWLNIAMVYVYIYTYIHTHSKAETLLCQLRSV